MFKIQRKPDSLKHKCTKQGQCLGLLAIINSELSALNLR